MWGRMERHDAIVIGAGLNGLTAAACLARAGLDVLVLERNAAVGGAAAGHELAPGYLVPRYGLGSGGLPPRIVAGLDLARHGLRVLRVDGGVTLFDDGQYQASYRDGSIHRREIARLSLRDADAWTRFRRDMLRAARALQPMLARPLDAPSPRGFAALRRLLRGADALAAMSARELHETMRIWTLSCAEFLDGYFESAHLKAHLAAGALTGATLGPLTPASAQLLLAPYLNAEEGAGAGAPAILLPMGGPQAFADALACAVTAHGGRIRTEAEVTDVLMRDRRAHGVALANGEEIHARAVLSDLDVKRSFLTLFSWKELPEGLVGHAGHFRMRGATAKINLALDSAPEFPGLPEGCPARLGGIRLAGTMDEMERAFDDWRMGVPPRVPLVEALVPTLVDRSLAPDGGHVMSVAVHYVPQTPHDGPWSAERKDELTDMVIARLAAHSPGLADRILAHEVLTPADIETEAGLTGGDLAQGEMTLDQIFVNRRLPGLASCDTPIRNFYLCSASVHPGSLVAGGAGANAAMRVAASLKRRGRR